MKDTLKDDVLEATYKPVLSTFEQEIDRELGAGPTPQRSPTYFYWLWGSLFALNLSALHSHSLSYEFNDLFTDQILIILYE